MKRIRIKSRLMAVLLAVVMMLGFLPLFSEATVNWRTALNDTLTYIATVQAPAPVYGDEWEILILARSGYAAPAGYYEGYYECVKAALVEQGTNTPNEPGGGVNQIATNARLALALTAIGVDAASAEGYDLLAPLTDIDTVKSQGLNAAVYALLAFDSNIDVYAGYEVEKEELIEFILELELSGGGFNWGYSSDIEPDMTGMVLQALAPYKDRAEVEPTIERALEELASVQQDDGGYESWGSVSAENSAQVIVAATALGLEPVDFRNQSGNSPLDSMMGFYMSGGGFQSSWAPGAVDVISTQQTGCALVAYDRFETSAKSLYDMRDCAITLTAISGVDLTTLNALISSAESKVQSNYTTVSWNAMIDKLNAAKAVRDDGSATQADVNQAASELNAAINALAQTTGGGTGSQSITVSFKLVGDNGTWIDTSSYTFSGSPVTVYDLIIRALGDAGLEQEGADGGYVSGIKSPTDTWLRQFDNGPNSGWIYSVDGVFYSRGIKDYALSNGSAVIMSYTNDYTSVPGFNVGGAGTGGGGPGGGGVGTDAEAEVEDGVAVVEITADDINDLISEAKTGGASEIVITVTNTASANSVEVDLTVGSLGEIAGNDMSLTIETGKATITFDTEALGTIAGGNAGDVVVTITASIIDSETELNARQQAIVGDNPIIDLSVMVGGVQIHSFGGMVTVSVPYTPPASFSADDNDLLTVYYIDANGNIQEMQGAAYDARTGMITFTTDHFSMFFVSEWISPFGDVGRGDWFYRNVRFTYSNELMNGTTDAAFSPQTNLTRAMLVTILYRVDRGDARGGSYSPFSDVAEGAWYYDAVLWANANGIVNGYEDGRFGPNDSITREQFATIMYRYYNAQLGDGGYDFTVAYSDADSVSDWAQDAMIWANANGLINGRTATTLAPRGNATRAETAAILQRFIEGVVNA